MRVPVQARDFRVVCPVCQLEFELYFERTGSDPWRPVIVKPCRHLRGVSWQASGLEAVFYVEVSGAADAAGDSDPGRDCEQNHKEA